MSSNTNASGGIHGILVKLHESLTDEDLRSAAFKCQDIIGDLGQECLLSQTDNELALQTSLLFSKDCGLLTFLRKSLGIDELRETRVEIINFLEKFLQRMSSRNRSWEKSYAVDIRDICMVVYTKDKGAKCRTQTMELLLKVSVLNCLKTPLLPITVAAVLGKIYELLGALGEVHPSEMVSNSEKLYKAFLGELKEQITSSTKEPKLFVVAGCLRGITALLVNFPKTIEEDPVTSRDIFQYALKTISPQVRTGLKLLGKHAAQFGSCLMDHYKALFDVMSKLCGHINGEMKKTSYYALEAFLKQVAFLVAENIEEHKSTLKFFMQKFCSIIKTMDSTHRELSIAIRGYGFFAAPCKKVCPQDVDLMYTELIQRCKQMYLTESDGEEESFYQLPSFLDSIACVLIHLDKIPEVYTPLLERLLVVQIDSYPQYSERMQSACGRAILKVLVAMASKGPIYIVNVPLPSQDKNPGTDQMRTGKWKVPSSLDYLDLYRSLLDCDRLKDSGFLDGAFECQNSALISLSRLLYDEVIKSILRIVEKLDLSVQKVTTGEEVTNAVWFHTRSSDPTAHLMPNKVKDFTAFINLVDFCSALLLSTHAEYFEPWVYPLSHQLILHSIRNPLVSGFYRLLAVSMKMSQRIQYYQGVGTSTASSVEPVKTNCFALLAKFGKEVCLRMKQYKDELLASCLTFALSLHHSMVALDIKAYCPALEAALKLGLSHVPLANAALDALEAWSSFIPMEVMQPCYQNTLPLLDGYLKSNSTNGSLFIRFMVSTEETMKKFVAWDTEKRLSFAVPFSDMKPVIYLDPFLPRISELALSTSDRQTKVAAGELLHSLVVYMVGKSAQMVDHPSSLPPMYNLHKKLFPVLLRLACDVDQVTRQLFEPLVMQLIHWFTNNKKFESQDTVAVLEAILDGLVDPLDSTLRDFCGRCVQEFVKWSVKQTTPAQQERSPANIKSLFKRIYSLALHPNSFKRLGAAMAFNSIYRQFREENALVDQFVFEVLVVFVESLALAHSDDRSVGLMFASITHSNMMKLLTDFPSRLILCRGFPADGKVCLSDVVRWLLEQCGRPQTECRHKCMELFYSLVPLLPGNKAPAQWLEALLKEQGVAFLIGQFEGGGLLSQPTLRELSGPFSVRTTLQWMDLLLAALDCYNTFISLHLVKPYQVLGSGEQSSFREAIRFFLTELATQELSAAEGCFAVGQKGSVFSPREVEQYHYSKGTIIVRLLEFASMVLLKCDQALWKLLEQEVFSPVFFELTAAVVCQPSSVGFNMADVEVMKNLPEVCVPLLKALMASPYRAGLENSLGTKLTRQSVEELCAIDLYKEGRQSSHDHMEMILSACKQIHKAGFLSSILHSKVSQNHRLIIIKLLMTVYKGIAPGEDRKALPPLDINSRRLADGLLQLAFSLSHDSLVELLLNTIRLSVPLAGGRGGNNFLCFSHGEYFYSLFQTTVNAELLRLLDATVPALLRAASCNPSMVSVLLNGVLDHTFRERSIRRSQGSRLVEQVLTRWDSLRSWWATETATPESKTATLLLLSKLLQIDSSVCTNINHEAFKVVFSTFTTLLVDKTLPLNLKSQALLVLPFFTTLPKEPLAALQGALEELVASHFPMQSDEFPRGSPQRNNYMDCVRKLLDALELSQSPLLLKLLAGVLCQDSKHIMEDQFQNCFQSIAKSSPERQLQLLCLVHGVVQRGDLPLPSMLQAMMERVLLPLASHCSPGALALFFLENVSDVMALLLSRFTKSSEDVFESQLLRKLGSLKLMELLYSRLPKEELYSKESRVNQAYCRSDRTEGNELSKALIKLCFEAFTENMAGESQLLEARRQYHCAAYNCAIAVISCSFSEAKFYQGFLFSEKPEKHQFILENLIDVQRAYNFPVEIEVPLERKKKYILIRKEVNEENGEAPVYLSSQSYMADSSLSEEMSQFDFSTGVQSFSLGSQNPEGNPRTTEEATASQDVSVVLEMDELNQHECMASMTALIGHMQRSGITPKVEQGSTPRELPPWMKFLLGKLGNPSTPLNIRLFVAKLLINTEEVFRPYAAHWLGPLLQLVVSGNNGGEGIHFMVVDIVVTALSWISLASPKGNPRDEVLANRLLEFLMKHSFHSKRAVFRHNLEIIRTLVECWKDCLCVPYRVIYERFSGSDPNSKDNSVGLQLLAIVLANSLPAYEATCGVDYDRYMQSLANNLSFTRYKEVYSAAAEIVGLILKNMAERDEVGSVSVSELKKKDLDDKFIICLSKVSKHFPPFMDRFVNSVFFLLPKLHGVLKTHCLECVLSRAEVIPDIYMLLQTKGFVQMMAHRDEARQRVCLDILHRVLALLTPPQMQEVLGAVTAFVSHPSPVCRERMYDILMWIQDNYSDEESMADETSVKVQGGAKETLLQGLVDENQGLQLYVRNFWSQEKRLPRATLERMLQVLHTMYCCQIERSFLSLATNLLLETTSQSPDFTRNMFEYPLSECTFQDYVIDSNWRLRSTVMTPMFVETQGSQGPAESQASPSLAGGARGQLRATQATLEFTQTQAAGGRRTAYNWLTGSSVDTLAEYSLGSESLSSSLLAYGRRPAAAAARRPTGEGFGTRRLTAPTDEGDSRSRGGERRADIQRLRRRFLKDQEKVSLGFARKEVQQQRQRKIKASRLRKESQVTLYRSYRAGDFPDIQIPFSSLIAPLQALAQRDAILAKQLFSGLFAGILGEMEEHKSVEEARQIKEELVRDLDSFLSRSTLCFPPFVACVQDMSLQHRDLLHLQPASISSTCLASLQQPSGILLLEKALREASGGSAEPPTKRSRGRKELPPDTEKWIHLARLYRSLEDYDVVRGIFGGKIGTKAITCTALDAEANNDFAEAVKLYNEALNQEQWSDGEPTESEKDFWDRAAMEAYSHLTEWKSLQYCSIINVDDSPEPDLDKMWAEPFYQEVYLGHMVRSMLKQLQQGQRDQALLSFVDRAMRVEERQRLLESHHSQELSLLYVLQDDYDRAKYYAHYAMELFMQNYSSVDTLLGQSRLTILQSVQALTEIQDFLQFIRGDVSVSSLKRLIRSWTDRYPDTRVDPMNVWDDVITSRCFFLDKICEKLGSQGDSVDVLVNNCKFDMRLRMADSAWKQSNFPVATKLLKELQREAKTQRGWFLQWVHCFSRFSHKRCLTQGPVEQITTMLKSIPLLEELESDCASAAAHIFRDQKILQGTSYHLLASAVGSSPSVLEAVETSKAEKVLRLAGSSAVVAELQLRALHLLGGASRKADEELLSFSSGCVESAGVAHTYMTLANFCDQLLRDEERSGAVSEFPELSVLPLHVVESTLKALKLNSEDARLRFPRLLQIIELYPSETLDLMTKEMATVPCWMLIGWMSQMVALLDKQEAVAVQHSIGQIAESYPQALVYALMASRESYHFQDSAVGHRQQEFVNKLTSLLDKGGAVQNFVDSLQQLTNPEMLFKDWWEDVKNELEKPDFDKDKMARLYKEMQASLGNTRAEGCGSFRKKFSQVGLLEKILGPQGTKLFESRKDKKLRIQVEDLMRDMRFFQKEPGNLKEYSPWLSSYKADAFRNQLEVPGQYDGRSKPQPEYHLYHPFLVKGGEDLRQDQRIEQLFGVMNTMLAGHAPCTLRSLQLRTYQVIPITSRYLIGLIEWMENTCTLKELLARSRTPAESSVDMRSAALYVHTTYRLNPAPRCPPLRAFVRMSTSPEAFLSLRSHFVSSHALLCVSHWILGIGDRHLSNFMVNTETGGMVGIDFGHAFGSATQFLVVPELMPFRLTRQFVSLMEPLKEAGLIQSVMVHSLRAFRSQPELLLNTMDVFVKEPSLDWKNFELKQLKKGGTWTLTVNTKEINWYPLQRVDFARRKLEGANPATITSEELRLGLEKDPAFPGMQRVALGTEEHNVRARLPALGLTVEQQVACLLDQATDPNLLGRVWGGWEPWV
uniref:DNA-dependent protein kinase catalytic subunit n=1 Tax=Gadus morhua TaxID=8049 RepID=A0A8C5FRE6_GADMO